MHVIARRQGVVQSRIVESPQVAPEPHQASWVFFLHASDVIEIACQTDWAAHKPDCRVKWLDAH
jgi:hypothetical protein